MGLLRQLGQFRQEFSTGIWPQTHPHAVPFWGDGRNVEFTDEGVGKMKGWSAPFTELGSDPVRGMTAMQNSGIQSLFFGDKAGIYRWNTATVQLMGSGYTGITDETVTQIATTWSMVPWGTWVLATNGVDTPQVYKDTGSFVDLTGITFTTAEIFIKRGAHVIAMNTSNGNNWVEWCSDDDVEDWTPTNANSAGNHTIRDMESGIKCAAPIGDRIAIYGKDSMYLMTYLGAPFYFGVLPALTGIGAISKQAVVSHGRLNYGFGIQGFWKTDGVSYEYIDEPAIREFVFANINWTQSSKICAYHDEEATQIRWFYPTVGSEPDMGVGFDYIRQNWYVYSFGRTSAIEREVFRYPVAGTDGGEIFFHNFGDDANGSGMTAYIETKAMDFGYPHATKFCDEVQLGVTNLSGTVNFQLGVQDDLDDAVTYSTAQAIDDGNEPIEDRVNARFIRAKIESTEIGATWNLSSMDIFGKISGGRR